MEHREWIHAHGFRTTSRHRCPDRVVRPSRDGGAGRRERFGRFGWYVAVGAGGNWTGGLEQAGYNRDNICYPTNQCPRLPEGYRWYYDLDPDSAAVFDLAVGRSLGAVRLEVSASGIGGGIQETFTGITYYDGSPVLPARDSGLRHRGRDRYRRTFHPHSGPQRLPGLPRRGCGRGALRGHRRRAVGRGTVRAVLSRRVFLRQRSVLRRPPPPPITTATSTPT